MKNEGGLPEARQTLRHHYEQLFSQDRTPEQNLAIQQSIDTLKERASTCETVPFTESEVSSAIGRLKREKTSGPTGISNEYLIALWTDAEGKDLLLDHLNKLLLAPSLPQGFCDAQVALLPKVTSITSPKEYRPINLMECLRKVLSWLLVSRLQSSWTIPRIQLGGIRGSQVCDALASAQSRLTRESKEERYCVHLSCNISAAFDSIDVAAVSDFICSDSDERLGAEALQLLQLILGPVLHFFLETGGVVYSTNLWYPPTGWVPECNRFCVLFGVGHTATRKQMDQLGRGQNTLFFCTIVHG